MKRVLEYIKKAFGTKLLFSISMIFFLGLGTVLAAGGIKEITMTMDAGDQTTDQNVWSKEVRDGDDLPLPIDGKTYYVYEDPVSGYTTDCTYDNPCRVDPEGITTITNTSGFILVTFDANGGSGEMADQRFDAGVAQQLSLNEFTAPVGYHFGGWAVTKHATKATYSDQQSIKLAGSVTLYAYWVGNDNTEYKVNHYQMTPDGTEYTLFETTVLTGTTGATVSPATKTYPGFSSPDKQSVTIAADGSTELDYRYARNQYVATFSSQSGDIVPARTLYYGQTFGDLPVVTRVGYDFIGWNTKSDGTGTTINSLSTMPAKSTTYYGIWSGSTNTKYTVKHRFMNTDGRTYTDEVLELAGTTGETITPEVYTRDGFTSPSAKSATIKADGTTVVEYRYSRNRYTVTYNANGGSGTRTMQYYFEDMLGELPVPTYKGYVFKEWNTKLMGDGDTVTMETKMPDGDMTVYAQWEPATDTEYTVKYYLMNTAGSDYSLADSAIFTGTTGTKVTPEVPVYTGFTSPAAQSKEILGDGSMEIEYRYVRNKYTITFDPNGGTGANASEVFYGANIGTLPTPSRVGYKLTSWNTVATGTGNTVTSSYKMPASDITVYAQWSATGVSYSVRHMAMNLDGETYAIKDLESLTALADSEVTPSVRSYTGFTSPDKQTVKVSPDGSTVIDYNYTRNKYVVQFDTQGGQELPSMSRYFEQEYGVLPDTYRTGYSFQGWSVKTSGGTFVNDYDLMPARNHTLYAIWKANTDIPYVINHYQMNLDGETYTLAEKDELVGTADGTTTAAVKSYTGFTSPSAVKITINPDGSTVQNYYYTRNQYTVTLNGKGGTGTEARKLYYGAALGALPESTRAGYTLKGWNSRTSGDGFEATAETIVESSVTYYALWNVNNYSINYVLNDGVNNAQNPYNYNVASSDITLKAPNKSGNTFLGWTYEGVTDPQLTVKIVKGSTGDKTFTANWSVNTYTATFDANGGQGGTTITAPFGQAFGSLPVPTRVGYTYLGWFTAADGGTQVSEQTTMPGADTTYYAHWLPNDGIPYQVDYYLMNTDGKTYTLADTYTYSGTAGQSVTPTVKNYEGFTSPSAQTKTIAADGTTVFDFRYARKTWSLKFDANTGEGTKTVTKYFEAEVGETPSTIKKTGYALASWNTKADGTGDTVQASDKMPNADLTIYAQWVPASGVKYTVKHQQMNTDGIGWTVVKTINLTGTTGDSVTPEVTEYAGFTSPEAQTVTIAGDGSTVVTYSYTRNKYNSIFNGNGGTPESTTQTYYYGAVITGAPSATREGYSLDSWNTDPNGNGIRLSSTLKQEAKDMTFYAQWKPNANTPYTVNYQQMNVNGRGYTTVESVTYTGKTDATVNAPLKKYTGFISPDAQAVTIAADGSSEVTYQYVRTQYNITYNGNGGSSASVSKHYYDAEIGDLPTSERIGYDFAGWNTKADGTGETYYASTKMPANNVTLYAQWSAHQNTPYKVTHSLMGIDGKTYVVADTDELTGTTGGSVTPAVKTYVGFTAPATQTVAIAGDGSTVVEYKYSRNKYNLAFNANSGTGGKTISYYYQAPVDSFQKVTKVGYNLIGWNSEADGSGMDYTEGFTMPAADLTIYAQWEVASDTKYTIRHYQMATDGRTYALADTQVETGTTGAVVTPEPYDYEGFTKPEAQSLEILADGTAALDYRYTRNIYTATFNANGGEGDAVREVMYNAAIGTLPTPTRVGYKFLYWNTKVDGTGQKITATTRMPGSDIEYYAQWQAAAGVKYVVRHYQMNVTGEGYTLIDTDNLTGTTGTEVTPDVNKYPGFTAPEHQTVIIAADGSTVVDYRYARNQYTVTFDGNGGPAAGTRTGYYGAALGTLPEPERSGFTFTGWNSTKGGTGAVITESSLIPSSDTTYYAQWKASADTPYTVEHHLMRLDGETYVLDSKEELTGATGAKVTPAVRSYTGFTSPKAQSVTIEGDGSTAVKYYYGRNQYIITFNSQGGTAVDPKSDFYGAAMGTLPTSTKVGYNLAGWFTRTTGGTQIQPDTTIPGANTTYYAQWTPISYQIAFDGNGGQGSMAPIEANYDASVILTGNEFTNPGSTFTGWNTMESGAGTSYRDKASVKNLAAEDGKVVTLYAQWAPATDTKYTVNHLIENLNGEYEIKETENLKGETGSEVTPKVKIYTGFTAPAVQTVVIAADGSTVVNYQYSRNSYTLSFDAQGGSEVTGKTVKYEAEYGELPVSTRAGYDLAGWYTSKTAGSKVDETTKMGSKDVTVYARWTAADVTYTVNHYQMNLDGSGYDLAETETLTGKTGETVRPAVKSYTGFKSPSVKSAIIAADGSTVVDYQYARNQYTITLNGNGGRSSSEKRYYGAALGTLSASYRSGYTFLGWFSAAEGGEEADPESIVTANTTYYAHWEEGYSHSYLIEFKPNGGGGSIPSMLVEFGTYITLPECTFTYKNHRFKEWNTQADGRGMHYEAGESVKDIAGASDENPEVNLYAIWDDDQGNVEYTVRNYVDDFTGNFYIFDTDYRKGVAGTSISVQVREYPGFTAPAPQTVTIAADGSTVVDYYYTRNIHNINFSTQGHGEVAPITKKYGESYGPLPEMQDEGYVFLGWYTMQGGGKRAYSSDVMGDEEVILYAHWYDIEDTKYTIKHYQEQLDSTYVLMDTEELNGTSGSSVTPAVLTYDGFTSPKSQTVKIAGDGSTVVEYQYARKKVTASFDGNGGTAEFKSRTGMYGAEIGTLPNATREGYTFLGWFTDPIEGNPVYSNEKYGTENATYYAHWKQNSYIVHFEANEGTGTMDDMSIKYGESVYLKENRMSKAGYTFGSWNTRADGAGTSYRDGAAVKNLATGDGDIVTLYAQWAGNTDTKYTVNHYQETLNGNYELTESELLKGTTGSEVSPKVKSYTGFTAPAVKTVVIAADGSTVVEYQYARNVYKLTYNVQGGSAVAPVERKYGEAYGELPTPVNQGYIFDGWFTKASGGDPVDPADTMGDGNVTIYAQWTAEEVNYTVSHYLQQLDGSYVLEDEYQLKAATGSKVSPDVLSYEGYKAPSKQSVTVSGDGTTQVKYNYNRLTYNVSYNGNGGPGAAGVTRMYGAELGVLPTSERTGYVFNGWNSKADGSGYEAETTTIITEAATFYAQWTPISYQITYDLAGGENNPANPGDYTPADKAITLGAPTKEGNTFKGWLVNGGTTPVMSPVIKTGTVGEQSFTATWSPNTYSLIFDANGGTGGTTRKVVYGEAIGTLPTAAMRGYNFVGWFSDKTAGYEVHAEDTMPGANTTYYAHWVEANDIPVHINHYLMNEDGKNYTLKETTVETGRTGESIIVQPNYYAGFIAPTPAAVTVKADGSATLDYRYTREQFTITFSANGGKSDSTAKKYHGAKLESVPSLTRTGYTFTGWNTQADGEGTVVTASYVMPMEDIIVYAQWKPAEGIKYTVKHLKESADGESWSTASTETFKGTTGSEVTPEVKVFEGFTSPEPETITIEGDGSTVLEYRYKRNEYTVTYDPNGGTGIYTDTAKYGAKFYADSEAAPERTGYTVASWNSKADGSGTKLTNSTTMPGHDVTYYAQWKPITYTINYFSNGGESGSTASTKATYDKTVALAANGYKKTGYAFDSWNTEEDGSGKSYAAKEAVKNLTSVDEGTVDLYVQWKLADYKITYNLNGGTNAKSNPATYTMEQGFTLAAPTKPGYTFTGWTGTDIKTATTEVTVETGSTGDRTYTANWSRDSISVRFDASFSDDDNRDGKRPSSVKATLLSSDGTSYSVSLAESSGYIGTIGKVYQYSEDGKENTFTATAAGGAYKYEVSGSVDKGYKINGSYTPETVTPNVSVTWNDSNNSGNRPSAVIAKLYRNGVDTGSAVALNSDNGWSASFAEQKAYEKGSAATFTVKADAISNYRTSISGNAKNGFVITATYNGGTPIPTPTINPTAAPTVAPSYAPTYAPTAQPGSDKQAWTVTYMDCLKKRTIATYVVYDGESVVNGPDGFYEEDYTNVRSNRVITPKACTVKPSYGADTGDEGLGRYIVLFGTAVILVIGSAVYLIKGRKDS